MKRLIMNWKFIALAMVTLVTVSPYLGIVRHAAIENDISIMKPVKIMTQAECSSSLGLGCSKAIVYDVSTVNSDMSVIPGITTNPSKFLCQNGSVFEEALPDATYGAVVELKKSNKTCEKLVSYFVENRDASFSSWYFPYAIVLPESLVKTIASSVNFYRIELRSIIAVCVPVLTFILFFLMNIIESGKTTTRFKYGYFVAILMTIFNGGIAEKSLFLNSNLTIPEVKEYFGLLLVVSFLFESKIKRFKGFMFSALICGAIEVFLVATNMNKTVFWDMIIFGWGIVTVKEGFSFLAATFFGLNCFYLVSVITPYNFVPPYAGTLFFLIYYIGLQVEQIRIKLVNWRLGQLARKVTSIKQTYALVKLIAKTHKIERISLALLKNDTFENVIFDHEGQGPNFIKDDESSNVVSKVFASGKAVIHIDSKNSDLGLKISSKRSHYKSRYFTSVPLEIGGQLLGVVNYTNYDNLLLHDDATEALRHTFLECGDILSRSIGQVSNRFAVELERETLGFLEKNSKLDVFKVTDELLGYLFEKYRISGYFSEVSSENNLILKTASGHLKLMLDEINQKSFKVNVTNEYGPIAIAFKESAPVVLQNWKPIAEKISKSAAEIYRTTDANSILTIPIVVTVGANTLRYLLWLQTDHTSIFSSDFFRVGKALQIKFSEIVSNKISQVAASALFDLAGSESISGMLHGSVRSFQQRGVLLMVDLAKSTVLGSKVSPSEYKEIKERYEEVVCASMEKHGFKIQMYIGDALLLTKETSVAAFEDDDFLASVYDIEKQVKVLINMICKNFYEADEPSLRFCVSFGDISCELVEGVGGGWKIVGNTISEVHKIESVAKQNRGGIYYKLDSEENVLSASFVNTMTKATSESSTVVYIPYKSGVGLDVDQSIL